MQGRTESRAVAAPLAALAATGVVMLWIALSPPLRNLATGIVPFVHAAGYLLSFAGWGWTAWRVARPRGSDARHCGIPMAVALGMGLTGAFVLLSGITFGLRPVALAAWSLAGGALAIAPLTRMVRARSAAATSRGPLDGLATAILAATALLVLPMALAPEATTDALEYHLMIPRLWLDAGRVTYLPGLVESNYPTLAEYLYVPVLAFSGPSAAKIVHLLAAVLLVATIHALARRLSPAAPALLAAALFASMPIVVLHAGSAWNDMFFSLFVVLAVLVLVERADAEPGDASGPRASILAAVLLGLAAWTKYTAALPLAGLLLAHALGVARRRLTVRDAVAFCAVFAVACAPWMLKNVAFTGNPVAPFLSAHLPTRDWTPNAARCFHDSVLLYSYDWTWSSWLVFPFRLALAPRLLELAMGAAPLLLAPFAFVRTSSRAAWVARAFLAGTILAWMAIHVEARSLLSLLAVLAAVGCAAIGERVWPVVRLRPVVVGLVLAASVTSLAHAAVLLRYWHDPLPVVAALESRAAYLTREAPAQPAFDWLNGREDVGTVLVVGPRTAFWLDAPALFSSFADPPVAETLTKEATSVEDLAALLGRRGVTHVVVERARYEEDVRDGLYSWSDEERARFQGVLDRHAKIVARPADGLFVYALTPAAPAP